MRVLIAAASKHGSTTDIARTITDELEALGVDADRRTFDDSFNIKDYDVAVLGSAVYMGNWMAEARSFVDDNRDALEKIPVWLFSSGPLGADELKPNDDPDRLTQALGIPQVQDHIIFAGSLDKSKLGIGERLITRAVHAPEGDFRNWDAVRAWAREIVTAARALEPAAG